MILRDALIQQAPSLALQRAASAEIARQDAEIKRLRGVLTTIADRNATILGADVHLPFASHVEAMRVLREARALAQGVAP